MLRPMLAIVAVAMIVGCSASDPTSAEVTNTLVLLDSSQHSASFGATQLTAQSTSGPLETPGGEFTGIGLTLTVTQSPPQSSAPLVSCVDVELYTRATGGTMIYSRNVAKNEPCRAVDGESSGPSGTSRGVGEIVALQASDLGPNVPAGTYYVRFHVTFADATVGEVSAGTVELR